MIPLRRIVEYATLQGQSYDIGLDFINFQRTIDGHNEQIKKKFEQIINSKFVGKRVRARSSRGYKQFERDYEFNVSKITIDDYYDNFVVVAHDQTTKKPKEYFLNPTSKIQIIGLSTGVTSPTNTGNQFVRQLKPVVASPKVGEPVKPVTSNKSLPVKENNTQDKAFQAYPIDYIMKDIQPWINILVKDPRNGTKNFIKSVGWMKNLPNNKKIIIYDLNIPVEDLKIKLNSNYINQIFNKISRIKDGISSVYSLLKYNSKDGIITIRVKKVMQKEGNQRI